MVPERRSQLRQRLYLPVRIRRDNMGLPVETLSRDVSGGGLRCLVQEPIAAHSHIVIDVTLPKRLGVATLQAESLWLRELPHCDQFEIGVAFIGNLPEEMKRFLAEAG